jgi:hypothetical protein
MSRAARIIRVVVGFNRSASSRDPLVETLEHDRPCWFVAFSQSFIEETRVLKLKLRSAGRIACKVHGDNGFEAIGCRGESCELHEKTSFEPQEPAVVRMPHLFELRFEKENRIDLAGRQRSSWGRKPAIDLLSTLDIDPPALPPSPARRVR